jgi:putative acetyltransferase
MPFELRAMSPDDHPRVLALWERSPGVGLSESDTREGVTTFLERNPGLSAVAVVEGGIVGAVLCGHDGRRGYLHHLAVADSHRGQGIARALLARCTKGLARRGIPKCNVFLFSDNEAGAAFWRHNGWSPRGDLVVFQRATASRPAAARAIRAPRRSSRS